MRALCISEAKGIVENLTGLSIVDVSFIEFIVLEGNMFLVVGINLYIPVQLPLLIYLVLNFVLMVCSLSFFILSMLQLLSGQEGCMYLQQLRGAGLAV